MLYVICYVLCVICYMLYAAVRCGAVRCGAGGWGGVGGGGGIITKRTFKPLYIPFKIPFFKHVKTCINMSKTCKTYKTRLNQ